MRAKVRSVRDGFRRAGMAFTKTPREIGVDEKTLEVLKAEQNLVVEVLPEPAKPEDQATGKEAKDKGKGK